MAGEADLLTELNKKSQAARWEETKGDPRVPIGEKERSAHPSDVAQLRRNQELRASAQRKQEEEQQAEIRAAGLREERRNAQQSESEQRRDEELKRRQEAERQAEIRAARLREERRNAQQSEPAQRRQDEELRRKQEAEQQAERRAAQQREERRSSQTGETAPGQREEDLKRKQEVEQQAEVRAARLRDEQRNTSENAAAQAQREKDLEAATQRAREAERQAEARAAKLREEQRHAQQSGAQIRLDEELQAAAVRNQKQEQRQAGREQSAAADLAAGKQRQDQQQEQTSQLQAEARRAAVQVAAVRKQETEIAASAAQSQERQSQPARSRARMARRTLARPLRVALKPGDTVTPPSPTAVVYLSSSKSLLVDENNKPINLRGITVRGLDTVAPAPSQSFPAALALDDNSLLELSNRWGANLVRLPFQAQTILSGNGTVTAAAMLAGFDATVAAITEAGAYVLLAMEPSPGSGAPAPDSSTTQAWQTLAARYQSEPRVLFELFASASPLAANWLQSAATLVATIRQQNPSSVIFLGSGRGGVDVTGLPLISSSGDPLPNIVYTIAASATTSPNSDDGPFRFLADSHPVFASMWSDDGSDLGRLSSREADLFERFGIGWAAANWNADPRLVADAAKGDFTPSGWGRIAQRALAVSAVNAFQPASAVSPSIPPTKGPALHHLKTLGSFVVDENDNPINLRGVTVQGLDTVAPATGQTFPAALTLDNENLLEISERWGANLVRLPFHAPTILAGNGSLPVVAMLAGLDATIAAITEAGLYVLLALQAPAGSGPVVVPDSQAAQVWQTLAERYQKISGVMFEIFSAQTPPVGNWPQVAATLVNTIRQRKPASLIFLGGGNGGSDVSGLPLLTPKGDPVFNLVYTVAVSPENMPDDGKLSALAESNPVFASVWSDGGPDFSRSSARVPDLFDRYGMGWAASNWNADPRLVVDAAKHDFTSTGWGLIAGRAFRLPGRALLKPLGAPTLEDL